VNAFLIYEESLREGDFLTLRLMKDVYEPSVVLQAEFS